MNKKDEDDDEGEDADEEKGTSWRREPVEPEN